MNALSPRAEMLALMQEKLRRKHEWRIRDYKPYSKQREFHEAGLKHRERLLRAGNQLGKAQPIDELVATPTGWRAIGGLRVGDSVLAGDGTVCSVTGVHPQGVKPVFAVTFDDGATTRCCEDHLWAARLKKRERFGAARGDKDSWSVYSLKQIRDWGGDTPSPVKRTVIPVPLGAQFDARDVPLDPYLIGVLLGDGCLRNGTVSFTSADAGIVDAVSLALPDGVALRFESPYTYFVSRDVEQKIAVNGRFLPTNTCKASLVSLGIYGHLAHEKFVPELYLYNSNDIRLGVLQGLMDTDGSVSEDGAIEFSTTSPRLASDVEFLARSFGGKVKTDQRQTYAVMGENRKAGRPSFRLRIRLPHVEPFRLERKRARLNRPVSTTDWRVLYSIAPAGAAECVCISVDHPSRTYLTRDFIVTHNSYAGAAEAAYHLTGDYPSWWGGRRFESPVQAWLGGPSGELVREGPQRVLLGAPGEWGTGAIPKHLITGVDRAIGVKDLVDSITVKHVAGGQSRIKFKSYDQGRLRWQAATLQVVWFDEEPPEDIYLEGLSRTNATGGMVYLTFTPLLGVSNVVMRFLKERSPDRADIVMTLDDAEHIPLEERARIIASYPEHERDARTRGIPILGSGRVFPFPRSMVEIEPFPIPKHWPRIGGLDFGWDHPTAAVRLAWDRDTDTVYVTDCYRVREAPVVVHAGALRAWGTDLPWAWPHDGLQHDKTSGQQLSVLYAEHGLKMLDDRAQFDDDRGSSVEAGVFEMVDRMQTNRWKVFAHCNDWFEEFDLYHRQEGKLFKERDDLISASRYAMMMLRYARTAPQPRQRYDERYAGRGRASAWAA